ncbi:MAG TPA: hypothetical protein VFV99_13440 [Kofleriaceae bacterium]|nr:hypothetical protein [Kofleriaceae bacterium]
MRLAILATLALGLAACQSSDVSRELGARCDNSNDCDVRCLSGADWPGGFCTIACETDVDCQADASCLEEEGGVCAFTCVSDAGCQFLGQGYTCKERDARGGAGKRMVCRGG